MATQASANVIFLDSFEAPVVENWFVYQNGVGDTGAWTAEFGGGVEIQNESLNITDAYHGAQYVELDSDSRRGGADVADTNTRMLASVGFIEGHSYDISFAYKPRTNNGDDDNGIELGVFNYDGTDVLDSALLLSVSETVSSLGDWMLYTVTYTAQAGFNAIGLTAFGRDNTLGGFVDYVTVTEVPVPAALPLFGFGLAGLIGLQRRRQRNA